MIKKANEIGYEDIHVNQKVEFTTKITEDMVNKFADLVGDFNPLHMEDEYARNTKFGERIVHGMLIASFFSTLFGMYCPGKKSVYLSQSLKFVAPLKINETIKVVGKVTQKVDSLKIISIETTIYNAENNNIIISGEAKVMVT